MVLDSRFKVIAACCFAIAISGCTSKQLYNAVQQNRIQACSKELPQDQEACKQRYEKSYEDYERDRQEVMDDN